MRAIIIAKQHQGVGRITSAWTNLKSALESISGLGQLYIQPKRQANYGKIRRQLVETERMSLYSDPKCTKVVYRIWRLEMNQTKDA